MRHALRATVAAAITAVLVGVLATGASADSVPSGPDGGLVGAAWTAAQDGPQQYPNLHIEWDVPITMSDGTVLKSNVYRPADATGRPIDTPTPTIVNLTPYTKLLSNLADHAGSVPGLSDALLALLQQIDFSGTPLSGVTDYTKAYGGGLLRNFAVDRQLIRSGYTQVVVDVRGTGFSQGIWNILQEREQQDTVEVIEWAARQRWSTGKVGMNGMSYSGINQLQAAQRNPAPLQAIFPIVPGSDLVNDVLAPGGGFGTTFIPMWLLAINNTKLFPDVQSIVEGDFDWKWLADRAASPLTYVDVLVSALASTRMEDLDPRVLDVFDDQSPTRRAWLGDPGRVQIPTFVVGGAHDLFTYSESKIYNRIPVPPGRKQLLLGNTYHGNSGNEYGRPGLPPRTDVLQRAWFDKWLKGIDNGIDAYGPITLRQQGGGWITTDSFGGPTGDPNAAHRRMYLSPARSGTANSAHDGSLTPTVHTETVRLTVAPGITGLCSNDAAQGTAGMLSIINGCAADSRAHEVNGLTFTSAPVAEPTTISGRMAVHLNTVHDAGDGYWVATLNDVAPDGQSTVLTSGQLIASLREIDEAASSRSANGDYTDPRPYTSLNRRKHTVAGEPTALDITLPAAAAVLAPGHRLRVDVYAGNFPKGLPITPMLLDTELKPQHLELDPNRPSFVNVPVGGNPGW